MAARRHAGILLLGLPAACLAAEPYATVLADHGSGSPATLRAAIHDLTGDFGPEYPEGEESLRRLDAVEQQMAWGSDSTRAAFGQLQRAASIANPPMRTPPTPVSWM